ncbi:unnamed protein product [Phaedon cochleariae]|uniref:Methylenetetrahydrofolate reductase (NAD(P)H) n=1 Tax=Phaedon cochleariae TaxID=80249 RepID=A0A9P0GHX8_PHACE|nr:unnamed protein product [Phaedon cochleariae]
MNILLGLTPTKLVAPNGIPPIVLKECAPELTPVLCKLFNYSYKLWIFPSNSKIARVQPVPEKGKKTLPSNYRPIGLLSVISKIMEKAINIELMEYLEHSGIRSSLAPRTPRQASIIWLASSAICSLLASFLSNRSLQVVVDGVSSNSLVINAGVPQGSILATIVFLLHINDLAPIPVRQIRNERGRNVDNINMELATILEWGSNNLVDFNANKTQACFFSGKADLTVPNISLSGVTIPLKTSIPMLACQLLMIYKAQIRPVLEYCSDIHGAATKHTLKLLDSVQKRVIRLVGDASRTNSLTSLEHRIKSNIPRTETMRETLIVDTASTSTTTYAPTNPPDLNHLDRERSLRLRNDFFSVEVCPNRALDATLLLKMAPRLCSVTWHAQSVEEGMPAVRLAGQLREQGHEVLLHLAGRNLNEGQVVEILDEVKRLGVRNLLVLQGDPSHFLEKDDAKCDFPYASHLVKFIQEKYGHYFVIGVAGYPEKQPKSENQEEDYNYLEMKVSCGADFIITQACYTLERLTTFVKRCRSKGIHVPITPGIFIISSFKTLKAMSKFCGISIPQDIFDIVERNKDNEETVREYGIHVATQLAKDILSNRELFEGFHVFTLNNFELLAAVLRRLGLYAVEIERSLFIEENSEKEWRTLYQRYHAYVLEAELI